MEKLFKIEILFAFFSVLFGLLILFVTPPFQTPDEVNHFLRAYSVSDGNIIDIKINNDAGNYLPADIDKFISSGSALFVPEPIKISKDDIKNSKAINITETNKFYEYNNTVLYSPIAYMPQAVGIKSAQIFTNLIYWIFTAGRIFNLLFYIILGYFAIKSIPFLKWTTVLIMLLPMNLSLAASLSPDAVLLSLCILYFSKILEYTFDKNYELNWQKISLLGALAILISLIKQSWLFVLFVLIIPKNKWGKDYWTKLSAILIPSFLVTLIWTKFAASLYFPLNNSNPSEQTKYIISHTINYIIVLFKSLIYQSRCLFRECIGVLGWLNILFKPVFYIITPIFGILNVIFCKNNFKDEFKLPKINNIVLISLILLIITYLCTTIYVSYTPVAFGKIIGLQGRYFEILLLPFAAFIALNIKTQKINKFIVSANIIYLITFYIYIVLKLNRTFWLI